jgi:hypothetical protein
MDQCERWQGRDHYGIFTKLSAEEISMPTMMLTPGAMHADPKHDLNAELQAFLETFMLVEFGSVPKELSKTA